MTKSIIRKAAAAVVAVAILATSTVAMAQGNCSGGFSRGQAQTFTAYVVAGASGSHHQRGPATRIPRPYVLQPVRPAGCGRQRRDGLLRRALGPGDFGHGHDSRGDLGSVYNDYFIERWAGLFQ